MDFKKTVLISLILLMIIAIPVNLVNATEYGTGLEVEKPEIYVKIKADSDINNIEKWKNFVKSKVESKLRENNIKVLDEPKNDYLLFIYFNFIQNNEKPPFSIDLLFIRTVEYNSNNKKFKQTAPTWSFNKIIKHNFTKDNSQFENMLNSYIDIFINEFHKANDF